MWELRQEITLRRSAEMSREGRPFVSAFSMALEKRWTSAR
jgi:hypothetical protein